MPFTSPARPAPTGLLAGQCIALTGRMASMTRDEAVALLEAHGARYTGTVNAATTALVVGDEGWPLKANGRLTRKLLKAQQLQRRGTSVEILSEAALLRQLGLEEADPLVCGRYSLGEAAAVLGVPRDRLRSWLRAGLIEPAETREQIPYFDLRQIIRAKALVGLAESGVSTRLLRRSLQQLRRWVPGVAESLAWLDRLVPDGRRIVFTSGDGPPFEPSGQIVFDFREPADLESVPFIGSRVDLFAAAVDHEARGELEAAADAYRELLTREGPDVEVCFNLGNVLYALGDRSAAAERFHQAVELDPQYAEAWHNLGNVLAESGQHHRAVLALRRAVELDPGYVDAHYGLADSLDELGQFKEARRHWESYLELGGNGEWAAYARQRLAEPA